jgi:hypothetical protein
MRKTDLRQSGSEVVFPRKFPLMLSQANQSGTSGKDTTAQLLGLKPLYCFNHGFSVDDNNGGEAN